jgi:O-antigen/teichoic acid export membrane protein
VSRIRELFSDSLVYGLSSVVARFINYLLVPFYTFYFEPAEYGIIGLIYAAIVFLNVLFQFGMESAYIRYASDEKQAPEKVFVTLQLALLGVATGLGALLYWGGSPFLLPLMSLDFEGGQSLFGMMLVILWLDALGIVPFAHLRIVRKSFTYALIKLANVIINVGLNIYLVAFLGYGLEALLISNIVASGITLLLLIGFTLPLYKAAPELAILKTALLFGLPYVPNGIGFAINEVLDRFFLVRLSPEQLSAIYEVPYSAEEITGIYNACYKLAIFMLLTVQMFRLAWQPFFMRYAKDKDSPELFARVFLYFNAASALVFLGIGLFTAEIAALPIPILDGTLIDSRYWAGLHIVPVLLLAYWFQGWFVNFSAGIFIQEKTIHFPKITLYGALVTLLGNLLITPLLGMLGAALATLGCYALMSMLAYYYARQLYPVQYPLGSVLSMMTAAVIVVALGWQFPGFAGAEWVGKLLLALSGSAAIAAIVYRDPAR